MNAPVPFEYAVLRVVPRVDRGEFVNVGVIVYCQAAGYLDAATQLDAGRVRALDPRADVDEIAAAVEAFTGNPDAGWLGGTGLGERFRWLTAPRSTIVQPGPVHAGLTTDPAAELTHLLDCLVR